MAEQQLWIGIDVAKETLEVASNTEPATRQWPNDEAGIGALVAARTRDQPRVIVLEATGGYEMAVTVALAAADLAVAVVNPRQVRDFAKATGTHAKTDAVDARILALFAARIQPPARPLPDATAQERAALLARRRQLLEMRTAEKNRRPQVAARLRPGIDAHVVWLSQQIAELDRELAQTLHASPVWHAKETLLCSIPGIGPGVARTLLGELPELGTRERGEAAALAGGAPSTRTGGSGGAGAAPGVGAPACAPRCTWRWSAPSAATPPSSPSLPGCGRRASRPRWRWAPACASS